LDRHDDDAARRANGHHDHVQRSLDHLRQRSLHRVWWNSARVALRRGQSGEPPPAPIMGQGALGKRV
jgi:hypothetical protein